MPTESASRRALHAQSQSRDRAIALLARRQHGVVSRTQLVEAGLGRGAIAHRLKGGRLHRVFPSVYVVGNGLLSVEGRWLAGVLSGGPDAVLSHRSAAALWEILASAAGTVKSLSPRGGGPSRASSCARLICARTRSPPNAASPSPVPPARFSTSPQYWSHTGCCGPSTRRRSGSSPGRCRSPSCSTGIRRAAAQERPGERSAISTSAPRSRAANWKTVSTICLKVPACPDPGEMQQWTPAVEPSRPTSSGEPPRSSSSWRARHTCHPDYLRAGPPPRPAAHRRRLAGRPNYLASAPRRPGGVLRDLRRIL